VRYDAFVMPRADGLPPLRLLLAFPAVLLVIGIVLVGLGLNGSSSGAFHSALSSADDPALISGHPQQIRSDEWNVGTVWTIAQVQQGLPDRTATFPGGMDAALPYDLPHRDWSIVFRPHQLGYLLLDVDHGTAWRWWSMGLALIAAAYCFVLVVLPRRPVVAAVLAVGFFYSPFFQWWYQSTTFWPVTWALVVLAALTWSARSGSRRSGLAWAPLVAYLTAVMAMGIYLPFIIPVALVVAAFAVGLVVDLLRRGVGPRDVALRLAPTIAAGLVGAAVTGVWLVGKAATVGAFLGTVYPGARLTPTGSGGALSATRSLASAFSEALQNSSGFLGVNSSEAASFFLVGAFLIPVVIWAVRRQRRTGGVLPWVAVALCAVLVLFMAFTLVPGWDPLARLLMLDRTTPERAKIGVGLASFALLAVVIRYADDAGTRPARIVAWSAAGLFLLTQAAVAVAVVVVLGADELWSSAPAWWAFALLSAAAVLLLARRRVAAGAALFALVSVASTAGVNPLYSGVYDLRESAASRAVVALDTAAPGRWVGVGDLVVPAILLESGVEAYNGTQGAPSREMWALVDPPGRFEPLWNRIGGVRWVAAAGEPVVSNPAPDQILVTFDACSAFAQAEVDYVLADTTMPEGCLERVSTHPTPGRPIVVYRVVAPPGR
jgi:hypothetical protein